MVFGYNLLEQQLGDCQYFPPGCVHMPSDRLFAQFHSPQSKYMKEEIIKDVTTTSDNPIQRLLLIKFKGDPSLIGIFPIIALCCAVSLLPDHRLL